jgi:pimeloyl-ACP methyl ester carboxylesterase
MRGEFVELGKERLYYYAAGSRGAGLPVLLLHGFPTSSHLWHAVMPLLPPGRRCVVVDQLGCGRSVAPVGAQLGIHAHANRLLGLMDALRIEGVTVVAHGIGALIALEVTRLAPARIRDLALICPASATHPLAGWGGLRWLPGIVELAAPSVGGSLLHGAIARRFVDQGKATHTADLYARPFTSAAGRATLVEHLRSLQKGVALPDMGNMTARASIVCGQEDSRDRKVAAAFARMLPAATLDTIPAAGHFLPEDAPERLATHLATFLAR